MYAEKRVQKPMEGKLLMGKAALLLFLLQIRGLCSFAFETSILNLVKNRRCLKK